MKRTIGEVAMWTGLIVFIFSVGAENFRLMFALGITGGIVALLGALLAGHGGYLRGILRGARKPILPDLW